MKLSDICNFNQATISSAERDAKILYIDTSSITENRINFVQELLLKDAPSRAQRKVESNTIVYSLVRPNLRHYGILNEPPSNTVVSTGFVTIDIKKEYAKDIDPYYLYLCITQRSVTNYLNDIACNSVSAYPSILPKDIANLSFDVPSMEEQRKLSSIIKAIDTKISLNEAINRNLEAMAKQLYDYWFVQFDFPDENGRPYKSSGGKMVWNEKLKREIPEGWHCGSLLDIAIYTNGLACQKFRPTTKDKLPVIKIREMHDGINNDTEYVKTDIPECVKVYDGDVLFSWSASLEVMLWAYGNGGLNQHIFKVTSKNGFPRSFYYSIVRYFFRFYALSKTP
jgi:type I restriction enzyme S subunit